MFNDVKRLFAEGKLTEAGVKEAAKRKIIEKSQVKEILKSKGKK